MTDDRWRAWRIDRSGATPVLRVCHCADPSLMFIGTVAMALDSARARLPRRP